MSPVSIVSIVELNRLVVAPASSVNETVLPVTVMSIASFALATLTVATVPSAVRPLPESVTLSQGHRSRRCTRIVISCIVKDKAVEHRIGCRIIGACMSDRNNRGLTPALETVYVKPPATVAPSVFKSILVAPKVRVSPDSILAMVSIT